MTIVERLQALGWKYNAQGVLCMPPEQASIPLSVHSDSIGDRYALQPTQRCRVYLRGLDGQHLGWGRVGPGG